MCFILSTCFLCEVQFNDMNALKKIIEIALFSLGKFLK